MIMILFIILLALIAYLNGDSSGVDAIAKIIGGFILFIVIGFLWIFITDNPLVLIFISISIIICGIIIIYKKMKNDILEYKGYYEKSTNDNIIFQDTMQDFNLTKTPISDFQKELQQNTNTPQQVSNEKLLKEQQEIIKTVQWDYNKK